MKKIKNNKVAEAIVLNKPIKLTNYYLILGLIVFFVFANTIGGGYNLDDELVTMNHRFTSQGLTAVKDIFTNSYYSDAMGYAYGYRPMVHLSFAIEHQFFGQSPKVSHFFNVLLYILSVVLFFKLLLKWVGIEHLKLAFLAVILFAMHPVHTEVVASIKNRDEILAFLFIILTGLAMLKYMDKNKFSTLIWTAALFSMAMLSKKSAYPMAIVLPIAIVLFQDYSIKKLFLISLSIILPAAFIGSELNLVRMILMIVLPFVAIGITHLIKIHFIQKEKKFNYKLLLLKPVTPIAFISLILFSSIYTLNSDLLLLMIPFLFWMFRINFQLGLLILVVCSFLIKLEFNYNEFSVLPVYITIGYGFYLLLNRKEEKEFTKNMYLIWAILLFTSLIIFIFDEFSINQFLSLLNIILFFWFLFKKPYLGIMYSIFVLLIVIFVLSDFDLILIFMLIFSILVSFKDKLKSVNWSVYFLTLLFGCLVAFISFENHTYNRINKTPIIELPTEIQKSTKTTAPQQNSFLKEGRNLEFAENTLVAPHTTQQTIGTGAATLGEYIRLMVFPNELSFYYGFARMDTVSLSNPFVWISILIHLGLIFIAIWQLRKRPIISFGILWYLLSIILFSNWVELVAGMVAERLLFVASAGFCIFIAGIVFWIKPNFLSKKPFIAEGLVGLILIAFAFKSIQRNGLWKDPITLMGNDIQHLQNSAQANNLYALRLMEYSTINASLPQAEKEEIYQKAIQHFSRAIEIDSTFFNALYNKGRAAQTAGKSETVIQVFKLVIEKDPELIDPYQFLLMEYEKITDWDSYIKTAKLLLTKSDIPNTYDFVSKGFFMQNKPDSSLVYINQGLKKFPGEPNLIERKKYLESVIPAK